MDILQLFSFHESDLIPCHQDMTPQRETKEPLIQQSDLNLHLIKPFQITRKQMLTDSASSSMYSRWRECSHGRHLCTPAKVSDDGLVRWHEVINNRQIGSILIVLSGEGLMQFSCVGCWLFDLQG